MRFVLGVVAVALIIVGLVFIAGPEGWDAILGWALVLVGTLVGFAGADGDVDN